MGSVPVAQKVFRSLGANSSAIDDIDPRVCVCVCVCVLNLSLEGMSAYLKNVSTEGA